MSTSAYINDKEYPFKEGDTILQFVRRHMGKELVPTLCDAPNLDPFGSCRVCSVDVALKQDGPAKAMASCPTPVIPGSHIYTDSERITRLRRTLATRQPRGTHRPLRPPVFPCPIPVRSIAA